MENIKFLGNGISVFFLYAPNPDDPYSQSPEDKDTMALRNRFYMSRLFFDLELHGFHVLSDLHLGDTQPSNWVQWYITRISQCNFVILVCSPSFKKLFEDNVDREKLTNPKARHLYDYRNAVYAEIQREVFRGKFIPVILDKKHMSTAQRDKSVPLMFQPGTVFCIEEEDKRRFNFEEKQRDFEKLVCHMAGINRVEIEKKSVVPQVPFLPPPHQAGMCYSGTLK